MKRHKQGFIENGINYNQDGTYDLSGWKKGDRVILTKERTAYKDSPHLEKGEKGIVIRINHSNDFPGSLNPLKVVYDKYPEWTYQESPKSVIKE